MTARNEVLEVARILIEEGIELSFWDPYTEKTVRLRTAKAVEEYVRIGQKRGEFREIMEWNAAVRQDRSASQ